MAKRAWVASGVFLGLSAIILLGLLLDTRNDHASDILTMASSGSQDASSPHIPAVNVGGTIRGNQPCKSQQNVVFIKTHKTASSTTAGIFDLYAYRHNLTVAVPPDGRPYMNRTEPFHRDMIAKTREKAENWKREVGFNIFSSHARYNRPEMDAVVHDAKYVTILRDPASQFLSAFVFFHMDTRLGRKFDRLGRQYTNVIEEFMKNPKQNIKLIEAHPLVHVIHNEQFFDLGLDLKYADDWDAIDATIAQLDKELDLVMLTEYYDESLILLRDLLCWTTEDILYTRRMIRNSTTSIPVSAATRGKIREWNAADAQLYDHYNRTLWRRIAEYGPSFDDELRKFRVRLQNVTEDETGSHHRLINVIKDRMKDMGIM